MKSYFLEGLGETPLVRNELSRLLPRQADPWLLMGNGDDPVAYLSVNSEDHGTLYIQADLSGRHFDEDALVLKILKDLQDRLGGDIRNDGDDKL